MSIEGQILDVLKKVYENDKPQALALIQSAEGGVEGFVNNAVDNAHAGGLAGVILNEFKGAIKAEVANYVASHGPEVVYEFIDALLADEAKKLGG